MINWKTTLSGIASIITGIVAILNNHVTEGIAAIVAGVGLLAAKDSNVTGGTKRQ